QPYLFLRGTASPEHPALVLIKSRTTMNESLPLSGITVISLEQAIAAPFCTRQLADQGARVIKIERPGVGDFARAYDERVNGLSSHFVWTNRSKESLRSEERRVGKGGRGRGR